jgi:predicted metal-dependent enzyme (double-stranded beta helix superfamily)
MANPYTLDAFVADLRDAVAAGGAEKALLARVEPLAVRFAASADLRARVTRQCDAAQGFGFQLLHEEPDHALAVALFSWLPGRGTPPHDHGTWGVVVGVEGDEVNTFWQRVDDRSREGHAELRRLAEKRFVPGDAIVLPSAVIHSVWNDTDAVSVSLHVYGRHINHTGRSQFDPEARTVRPWIVRQTGG